MSSKVAGKQYIILTAFFLFIVPLSWAGNDYRFVENKGQWHDAVLYKSAIPGGDLYVLKNALKYVFYNGLAKGHHNGLFDQHTTALRSNAIDHNLKNVHHAVEIRFIGANEASVIEGISRYPEKLNYIKGNDPKKWGIDVSSCAQVFIHELYPGIDLSLYSNEKGIKYDILVDPGVDPEQIQIVYEGQSQLKLRDNRVVVQTVFGEITEHIPVSYNLENNARTIVNTNFILDENQVRFSFPQGYDKSQRLVIDPELIFSTYSGSFADNWGFTATYDSEGNLFSGGIVLSTGFPTTNGVFQSAHSGEWDVGILKYDQEGKNLLWATYLGGSFSETPQSIIENSKGELVIYGTTSSPDFPTIANSFQKDFLGGDPIYDTTNQVPYRLVGGLPMRNGTDVFLAILSQDGSSLVGSTFIGGSENDGIIEKFKPLTKNYGDQFRGEVIVDNQDNIYVASNTSSPDFLLRNAAQADYAGGDNDGVVMKFNGDLSDLFWSTFVGGSGMDALYAVKVDKQGNVFAAGGTDSDDFPVTEKVIQPVKPGVTDIDGVVVKINPEGSAFEQCTYIGTPDYDQVYFLELDSSDRVYLLGQTQGMYPVSPNVYSNPNSGQFIHKLTNNLDSTFFSTVIGSGSGSPDFSPTAFLINECENIFVSGWGGRLNEPVFGYIGGSTTGLPISPNAFQTQTDGTDFYLAVLLQDAKQLLYGTYFGEANGRGEHVDGGTSRFDKRGIVYQSVCGGCGGSSGFPTWPPDVWSTTNNSNNCNNAAFKFDLASLLARFETDTEDFTNRGIRAGCYPLTLVFLNESLGGENYFWDFGEGTTTNKEDSIIITYEEPGFYPVTLTATDINTCIRESTARGTINVYDYGFNVSPDDSICYGESIQLAAIGGVSYEWSPSKGLNDPFVPDPIAAPDTTTIYSVFMEDENGCIGTDSVHIDVVPKITADFEFTKQFNCKESSVLSMSNTSEGASNFIWDFGDKTTSEEFEPTHRYQNSDSLQSYTITLTAGESFCSISKSISTNSVTPFIPNVISPNDDGKNDVFKIITEEPVSLRIFNRWGGEVYENETYQNTWDGGNLSSGVYFYELIMSDNSTRCNGWLQVLR